MCKLFEIFQPQRPTTKEVQEPVRPPLPVTQMPGISFPTPREVHDMNQAAAHAENLHNGVQDISKFRI